MLFLVLNLLVSHGAFAYEKGLDPTKLMNSVPERVIRLQRAEKKAGRGPASVEEKRLSRDEQNQELEKKLKVGTYAIVRDSVDDWNDQVVKVTSRYDDGSRQVQLDNGRYARVKFDNLVTLSPETERCCKSNGVDICKGDTVWHPVPSTSIGVPQGKVLRVFENCTAVVRDGLDYVYAMRQLGKSVDCAPQKNSVCVGKIVWVEGWRDGKRYQFEGPVEQVFTNGTVLVKAGLWLLPTDASTAVVQTDTLNQKSNRSPASAVVGSRDGQRAIPVPVYPEIEPFDAHDAQELIDRKGITVPIAR
jgi:hypothetical protein